MMMNSIMFDSLITGAKLSPNECQSGWRCFTCSVSHSDETGECYIHCAYTRSLCYALRSCMCTAVMTYWPAFVHVGYELHGGGCQINGFSSQINELRKGT